ncbi:MAG: sugar phosphate isomerase/epimerase [Gemmatimonadetes bacterium]|nr:sugar phosphate isomerase/epimerase [Gemmatimonadota bacterium]
MYSCINGATTMPYTLEQDLAAAATAGFEAVEIWSRKLDAYLEDHDTSELKALLDSHGLRAASLCPYGLVGFSDNREELESIERAAKVAAAIDCPVLLVCADAPPKGMDRDEAFDAMAAAARAYAERAAAHGVKIAIEPLGRHPFIPGPREALEVIDRAGHGSLGLMMDFFHYYKSGVSFEDIRAIPNELLLIVHVDDCEDLPPESLTDQHRVYMGEGVLPLRNMLGALREKGYSGALSVEIFREEYWKNTPVEISISAKAAYDRMMEA